MTTVRAILLAVVLLPGGFGAWAEDAPAEDVPAEGGAPLPYAAVPVNLNGADYLAEIDISGAEPMMVNGVELDTSDYLPGAVRVSRVDGASMADEGFRAREVIEAACATQGYRFDSAVAPLLSPAGRWIFPGGCG